MDRETRVQMNDEKKRIKAKQAEILKELEKAPVVRVEFKNLDLPQAALDFNYEGVKTYHLEDGGAYDLPVPIINHLNGKKVPIYKPPEADEHESTFRPEPADMNERIVGYRARFALTPINAMDMVQKRKPGRPPKEADKQ